LCQLGKSGTCAFSLSGNQAGMLYSMRDYLHADESKRACYQQATSPTHTTCASATSVYTAAQLGWLAHVRFVLVKLRRGTARLHVRDELAANYAPPRSPPGTPSRCDDVRSCSTSTCAGGVGYGGVTAPRCAAVLHSGAMMVHGQRARGCAPGIVRVQRCAGGRTWSSLFSAGGGGGVAQTVVARTGSSPTAAQQQSDDQFLRVDET